MKSGQTARRGIASAPVLAFHLAGEARQRGACFEAPRDGDAGFDIRAAEELMLEPGSQAAVSTGLRVAIPSGWVGIVKDRSSMASRRVYTHAGVIDSGYRGEVRILLSNHGSAPYHIQPGAKIAQMLLVPCITGCVEVALPEDLGSTERGEGGFGSTGR